MTERLIFNRHHKDAPKGAIYIGRGTPWGNEFGADPSKTREEVITLFEEAVKKGMQNQFIKEQLASLYGKPLVCSCYPKDCHGNVLIKYSAIAHAEIETQAKEISF